MATFDLPEMPANRMSPHLMMGVASPLWVYFGAAAAGGVAYWWMTRWARPVNLEAMFAGALPAPVEIAAEVVEAMVEAVEAAQAALVEDIAEFPAVGGESAPVSPVLELAPAAEPEPAVLDAAPAPMAAAEPVLEAIAEGAPEVTLQALAEPVLEAAPEPVIEEPAPAFAEAPPKARAKKSAPPVLDGEA